uniref:THAP domain-containing protein 1 n=1 Tax=Sinocyclocheilus rhinocerous TaxID=307959 RepID=A0A673FNC7_9TELE
MPASRKCVLPGCDHLQNSSVSLFKFPKNDDIKKRWIKFVKRHLDGELRITTNTRLCSEHFTPDSFINFHRRQLGFTDNPLLLVNGAEPTISRPGLHPSVPPTSGAIVGSTHPPISVSCIVFLCYNYSSVQLFGQTLYESDSLTIRPRLPLSDSKCHQYCPARARGLVSPLQSPSERKEEESLATGKTF